MKVKLEEPMKVHILRQPNNYKPYYYIAEGIIENITYDYYASQPGFDETFRHLYGVRINGVMSFLKRQYVYLPGEKDLLTRDVNNFNKILKFKQKQKKELEKFMTNKIKDWKPTTYMVDRINYHIDDWLD